MLDLKTKKKFLHVARGSTGLAGKFTQEKKKRDAKASSTLNFAAGDDLL